MSLDQCDILDRLHAMMRQERSTRCVINYFRRASRDIDASHRAAMATWVRQVQTTLQLSPETVWMAMSFFDRYLSSGRGESREVLKSKCKFQLAAITCFYTAVKIHEPVVLGIDMLLMICRGTYTEKDIVSMERDVLSALEWKVFSPTPMDFARHFVELLPKSQSHLSKSILDICQEHVDYAIADVYFLECRPSVVGISCLARSLFECSSLPSPVKIDIWNRLSCISDLDMSHAEIFAAREHLSVNAPVSKPIGSKYDSFLGSSTGKYCYVDDSSTSSPVCVTQAARQA